MSQNNKLIIASSAGVLGLIAVVLTIVLFIFSADTTKADTNPPIASPILSTDMLSRFNSELSSVLDDKHKIEMAALGEQRTLLETLTKRIDSLEAQKESIAGIQTALTALTAQKENTPLKQNISEPQLQSPLRSINLTYAIDDRWDYSDDDVYNHLLQEHNFNADGYSFEDMKIIHDNLHSGYPALGVMQTYQDTQPVQYYRTKRGLFSRAFQSNAYCVGGNCN
jgi:hypothetical protein